MEAKKENKIRILALAKILTQYTDEEHSITTADIIDLLEKEYGISFNNFEVLSDESGISKIANYIGCACTSDKYRTATFINDIISDQDIGTYPINFDIDEYDEIRPSTYKLLETYIELNELYFANDLMRERLENNQHSKATLRGWYNGERIEVEDVISNYVPYESITMGSVVYPFIAPNIAVTEIISSTGEMLYQNQFVPLNYNFEDERDIEKLRRRKFGLDREEKA